MEETVAVIKIKVSVVSSMAYHAVCKIFPEVSLRSETLDQLYSFLLCDLAEVGYGERIGRHY